MKLKDYLSREGLTAKQFADRIGASSHGVEKWSRGERYPRQSIMARITAATGGEVTANDFFACDPTPAPAASSEAA